MKEIEQFSPEWLKSVYTASTRHSEVVICFTAELIQHLQYAFQAVTSAVTSNIALFTRYIKHLQVNSIQLTDTN